MSNVGIVLVSHSMKLASGLSELLDQIQQDVPIAAAGGTSEDGIGTDAFRIKEAIESVYTDKGAVVLFDLGSALLNAEMALELLPDFNDVRIADAPLVEGAYAAVIQSGIGGTVEEVAAAAEEAKKLEKITR
ncbi:dihydroxyacetone kinase phosphoryl donor subunit DhaM [Bacillus sp. REN3]|uniref:dihydroxyacetone kinase phosphoryl donor subunit DhaM n=1 Tax=Bacillus sp. REN3 TaxID=2802440 RepID=UPI001AEEBB9E|nr:dihydroxyacetone kinase phosphoryl donor subunit DhaM [Bacillus sp. REN3]